MTPEQIQKQIELYQVEGLQVLSTDSYSMTELLSSILSEESFEKTRNAKVINYNLIGV